MSPDENKALVRRLIDAMNADDGPRSTGSEGDKVVTRWTFQGTHQGELFGIPPTGRAVTMSGIFIDRIAGGQVIEHWDEADILGLKEQLEAAPA